MKSKRKILNIILIRTKFNAWWLRRITSLIWWINEIIYAIKSAVLNN